MSMDHNRGLVNLTTQFIGLSQRHNPQQVWLDFGLILDDMSLKLDHVEDAYPWGSYGLNGDIFLFDDPMLTTASGLPGVTVTDTSQGATVQSWGLEHTHDVPRPARLAPLMAGHRVLVAL